MRLRRLLRVSGGLERGAWAVFGIISGVEICRPGDSYTGSLLGSQQLSHHVCSLGEDAEDDH